MRRSALVASLVLFSLAFVLLSTPALASSIRNRTVVGTVDAVSEKQKAISVDTGLKNVVVFWDEDTRFKGGSLEAGKKVRIRVSIEHRYELLATTVKVKD